MSETYTIPEDAKAASKIDSTGKTYWLYTERDGYSIWGFVKFLIDTHYFSDDKDIANVFINNDSFRTALFRRLKADNGLGSDYIPPSTIHIIIPTKQEIEEMVPWRSTTHSDSIEIGQNRRTFEIALTFDDGPHSSGWETGDYTNTFLDILQSNGICATFLVDYFRIYDLNRNRVKQAGMNSLIRMRNEGHEIGLHGCNPSVQHGFHYDLTRADLKKQLSNMKKLICDTLGIGFNEPMSVRPPGGLASFDEKKMSKATVQAVYTELNLILYLGEGTARTQSWQYVLDPSIGFTYDKFIDSAKSYINNPNNRKLVLLMHDIREKYDLVHFPTILKSLTDFAEENNIDIQYKHLKDFW